jgi:hypothetical protein
MCTRLARSLGSALFIGLLFFAAAMPAAADGHKLLVTDAEHVAIGGYDTVAYFTDGKPLRGSSAYEYAWDDAKWRFASAAHRDLFIADPDRYMPQFGGFCAGAMANGVLVPANPQAWAIVDGKLYMIAGKPEEIVEWKADAAKNIRQADKQWPVVQDHEVAQP